MSKLPKCGRDIVSEFGTLFLQMKMKSCAPSYASAILKKLKNQRIRFRYGKVVVEGIYDNIQFACHVYVRCPKTLPNHRRFYHSEWLGNKSSAKRRYNNKLSFVFSVIKMKPVEGGEACDCKYLLSGTSPVTLN